MSLEQALAANTAAIEALTAALQSNISLDFTKASKPTAGGTKVAKAPSTETPSPVVEQPQPAVAATTLTYDDIKKPFLDLVRVKGRDTALAAIAPHTSLKDVEGKTELYDAVLKAIQVAHHG